MSVDNVTTVENKNSNLESTQPKIGLALGGGAARGWAHIGVINALIDEGIDPDIICGCSVGSIVGAAYASDRLDKLKQWACNFTKRDIVQFFELNFSFNGFVDSGAMSSFLGEYVCDKHQHIQDYSKVYATVSTDLKTGHEIWFTEGLVMEAINASMSLPGLFAPVLNRGRWLVDGGLVNPVPVSVCRALGADIVIAVNLNGNMVGRHFDQPIDKSLARNLEQKSSSDSGEQEANGVLDNLAKNIKAYSNALFDNGTNNAGMNDGQVQAPGIFDAIAGAINITQDRITRSRMAGDPPEILLAPDLSHIGLLEFHHASQAVKEGRECVQRMLPDIRRVLSLK